MVYCCLFFFFFFQAEDGIRDFHVTGVQTCALPISWARPAVRGAARELRGRLRGPVSHGAPEVLAQSRRWFTQMGLTLNEQKTRVRDGRRESFSFLGYTFGPMRYRKDGHWYLGAAPATKAVQRVKGRIRQILRPSNQAPWDVVVAELNRVLRGWAGYFG